MRVITALCERGFARQAAENKNANALVHDGRERMLERHDDDDDDDGVG